MSEPKTTTVQAIVDDAQYDGMRRAIMVNASIDGQPRSIVLSEQAVAPQGVTLDREAMADYMKEYANKLNARSMPFNLVLTEDQLSGEGECNTIKLQ